MSIIEQAKSEMKRANFGDDNSKVMLAILRMFFDQWDSGGAVHAMAPVLQRLLAGKPLSPLTGADDEWIKQGPEVFQNVRCSTVFKERDANGDWITYDIERKPSAGVSTARHRWAPCEIRFPYLPEDASIPDPVVTI